MNLLVLILTAFNLYFIDSSAPMPKCADVHAILVEKNYPPKVQKLSEAELEFATNFLELTKDQLLEQAKQLTAEELNYRPKDGGWTALECYDHIITAERGIYANIEKALSKVAGVKESTKFLDAWIVAKVTDRGNKVKTPIPDPKGSMEIDMFEKALQDSRDNVVKLMNKNKNKMRGHFGKSPYGDVDAYQLVLIVAAHSLRHYHQIQENLQELNAS